MLRYLHLGVAAPAILLLMASTDLWLRFTMPESTRFFRAWEPMALFASGEGTFRPSHQFAREKSYGDLSQLGNYPAVRQFRTERFTTDAAGYRNPHSEAETIPAEILMAGDSFMAGCGLPDDKTLPEKIRAKTGWRTYNVGSREIVSPDKLLAISKRLKMDHGVVVHQYLPRWDLASFTSMANADPADSKEDENKRGWRKWSTLATDARVNSPLRFITRRFFERVQDDHLLPNIDLQNVRVHKMRNGAEMLFSPVDEDSFYYRRSIEIGYWKKLDAMARAANHRLVVMLVPDKYLVYRPLLPDARPRAQNQPEFLDELEKALKAENIPVVNLLSEFRTDAARRLESQSYIYWRDDTHWNEHGVDLASARLIDAIHQVKSK